MRHRKLKSFQILMLLAVLIAAAGSSSAAEDGGGRSIWAHGAGNRALSLGGAYASLANDASASLWNPAGLGLVLRSELQLSHVSLYGLGFDEQYASVVIPSWRLGGAAFTLQHFGVSGIDRRDDRNVLLADDLSESQMQMTLGFGRSLGRAWSVGGALKLQTHSLAGNSASGVGLDLGLIVRPLEALGSSTPQARRLSLGLVIRNALEPSLRLERDAVKDPTGMRLGIGYWLPIGVSRTVLAAIDLEKTRGMDTHLHAGVEVRPHPVFALRAGLNDGRLTAGTGVQWRSIDLDYAFEDNLVEVTHRIGIGFGFGRTTVQARQASLEAQEKALQERLATAFEQRQQKRIDELLATIQGAMDRSEYENALEQIGILRALAPEHPQAIPMETLTLRERAANLERDGDFSSAAVDYGRALALTPADSLSAQGVRRCRAESDRIAQRSRQLREEYARSLDAFTAGDLLTARAGFGRLLELEPGDEDAAAMLRRTDEAIQQRIESLLSGARSLVELERFDEAASKLADVAALDPNARGLASQRRELDRAQQEAARRVAAAAETRNESPSTGAVPPTGSSSSPPAQEDTAADERQAAAPTPPTEDELRELEDLYKRGLRAMREGGSDEALRYWELVWAKLPTYQNVSDLLTREYLMRGMESFASGRLSEAVVHWENALRVDPEDERAIGYLARAREQLARTREILGEGR